jgi:hypothetical protein
MKKEAQSIINLQGDTFHKPCKFKSTNLVNDIINETLNQFTSFRRIQVCEKHSLHVIRRTMNKKNNVDKGKQLFIPSWQKNHGHPCPLLNYLQSRKQGECKALTLFEGGAKFVLAVICDNNSPSQLSLKV